MKKLLLFPLISIALIGVFFFRPAEKVQVSAPEYANRKDVFGYIKNFDTQNHLTTIRFDEARWMTAEEVAGRSNPFGIENTEQEYVNLFLSPHVHIDIVDLTDEDDALRTITLQDFKNELLREPEIFGWRVFWLSFNEDGLVERMSEQYVP